MKQARPLVLVVPALLASAVACSVPSERADFPVAGASAVRASDGATGSKDPMDHLNVLASDAMEGRGTGAPGHQRAADYVASECVKAGLVGAYPASPDPYFQPFTVGSLAPAESAEDEETSSHDFGIDLFEHAIYVSGEAGPETRHEMGERVCAAMATQGHVCPPGVEDGSVDPRPVLQTAAPLSTNNVVGLFPGSGPHKSEIVLFSAHLDHLGKNASGVFPGADDNGSGSAVLLTLMHSLAQVQATRPLDRTVAFLWTSGEERGLLGAAYFVDNTPPSVPLAQIKQVVNMDMVGYWDDSRFSIGVDGSAASEQAVSLITAANQSLPAPFATMNRDIQQYSHRQDGYAFSRRNVPHVFVFEGLSNAAGGGSLMANYHRTTDTLANFSADNGGTKIRKMSLLLSAAAEQIANAP